MMRTPIIVAVITLVCSSAIVNATEPLADPVRISVLIRQLDADDFKVRDRATRELRQIGIGSLPMLNAATVQGTPEMRERAERLAAEIRRDSYLPGHPAEGLQATLRADRETYPTGKGITMLLEIKNISATDLVIPRAMHWGYELTYGPDKHRVFALYVPCHTNIQVHQLSGRKAAKNLSPYACGHPGHGDPQVVKANNSMQYAVPVSLVAPLPSGEYEVEVIFQTIHSMKAVDLLEPKRDDAKVLRGNRIIKEPSLVSNKVRFVVE